MNMIDLFCGVGGLTLGLERAGFKSVLGVEKNPSLAQGYKQNFPNSNCLVGDISKISLSEYVDKLGRKKIDLIAGGPPCQGFSQKGQRKNLDDERNYLFKYFLELVNALQPQALLIENVPNILSTSDGYFYREIKNFLENSGYAVTSKTLRASDFGVPQNRRRAFIVGFKDNNIQFKFPEPLGQKVSVNDALSDLPILESGQGQEITEYRTAPASAFQKEMRKASDKVYNHIATKHSQVVLERLALIPEGGGRSDLPKEHLTKSIYSGTWTRLEGSQQAPTITTRFDTPSSGQFTLPNQDRCLTVREAARLQSFPDHFIFTGSKSNQMLQVGNAVPPLLSEAIGREILNALKQKSSKLAAA